MDVWLERLDRLITIIRPKAYNVIARTIIGLGVALVAESQLNIVQAVVIAVYESLAGHSEILREFMTGASNPWIGLFLIVIGLIYHYLITIGKEQVKLKLSQIPQKPVLELKVLNADLEGYESKTIPLRGHIVNAPPNDQIPEFRINYDLPNMESLSNAFNTIGNIERNPKYYQERAEFLKTWGGSELLTLKLFNQSEVLATGVEIEIKFSRIKGISADNTKEDFPLLPAEKNTNRYGLISTMSTHTGVHYDIKQSHTSSEYIFRWNIGEIQANTHQTSDTYIFLRSEMSHDIVFTIYCDQFSSPAKETCQVTRNEGAIDISVDDLRLKNEKFDALVNECVMDGYIQRKVNEKYEEYELEDQEFLPRS